MPLESYRPIHACWACSTRPASGGDRGEHLLRRLALGHEHRHPAPRGLLSARIRDANLSGLVFSDILDDLKALAAATKAQDTEQVYRRLSHLGTVLDDMSRRAARGRRADVGVDEAAGTGRRCRPLGGTSGLPELRLGGLFRRLTESARQGAL